MSRTLLVALFVLSSLVAQSVGSTRAAEPLTAAQARQIAAEAYVFGYPLVLMDFTRQLQTNVPTATVGRAPVNQFSHTPMFPDDKFRAIVSPNADTLYSIAWLDLRAEPLVLHVPDTGDRYYVLQALDGWTNVFASIGKRTTGTREARFLLAGPDWHGDVPNGMQVFRSPTDMGWIIGRVQTNGQLDFLNVHKIQRGITLAPLSRLGQPPQKPAPHVVDKSIDMTTPPPKQVAALTGKEFFTRLNRLMTTNPPAAADAPALARFERIGVAPGDRSDFAQASVETAAAIEAAPGEALKRINAAVTLPGATTTVNGWRMNPQLGEYGTNYLKRAAVAMFGLGANLNADAIYPATKVDNRGDQLTGAKRYVMHFAAGQTPPVNAFWSISMYDMEQFFIANPIKRFAIGDRDALAFNADGSLDIYIQHDEPAQDDKTRRANWLPAPAGDFNLIMRLYWPQPAALDGKWKPPAVEALTASAETAGQGR